MEQHNKKEIVDKIKNLLDLVSSSPKMEKYKYVCEIYSILGANKQFVIDHSKFCNTFLSNAHQLIKTIVRDFDDSSEEERKLMCLTTSTIIEAVSSITN